MVGRYLGGQPRTVIRCGVVFFLGCGGGWGWGRWWASGGQKGTIEKPISMTYS